MNAHEQRELAVFDSYVGLRRLGYTYIGALRTLRTLGLSLAEAKAAADRAEPQLLVIEEVEECPVCDRRAVLSDAREHGVTFHEAVCDSCRRAAIRDSQMDDWDRGYERAIANGWAD